MCDGVLNWNLEEIFDFFLIFFVFFWGGGEGW